MNGQKKSNLDIWTQANKLQKILDRASDEVEKWPDWLRSPDVKAQLPKGSLAMKQTLYYVIKYEGKYYAPYLKADVDYSDINKMLTQDRYLAARFLSKEVARFMADQDIAYRKWMYAQSAPPFDPSKVKIVRVFKKI
jgi:hypothetical protein